MQLSRELSLINLQRIRHMPTERLPSPPPDLMIVLETSSKFKERAPGQIWVAQVVVSFSLSARQGEMMHSGIGLHEYV